MRQWSSWGKPTSLATLTIYLLALYFDWAAPLTVVVLLCTAIGLSSVVLLIVLTTMLFGWVFTTCVILTTVALATIAWWQRDLKDAFWCNMRILVGLGQ